MELKNGSHRKPYITLHLSVYRLPKIRRYMASGRESDSEGIIVNSILWAKICQPNPISTGQTDGHMDRQLDLTLCYNKWWLYFKFSSALLKFVKT